MRETFELLVRLEASREPRLQRQLDGLRARTRFLESRRDASIMSIAALRERRQQLRQMPGQGEPITAFELRCAGVRVVMLDIDIAEAQNQMERLNEAVAVAEQRAKRAAARLSHCLRRQVKLDRAVQRLGCRLTTQRERQEHAQADHLSLLQWQGQSGS